MLPIVNCLVISEMFKTYTLKLMKYISFTLITGVIMILESE